MYTSHEAVVRQRSAGRTRWDVTIRARHLVLGAVTACVLTLGSLALAYLAPAGGTSDALAPALLVVAGVGVWGFVSMVRALVEHAECSEHEPYRLD
jgi:O-antigen/teichoic acid export membrane protein